MIGRCEKLLAQSRPYYLVEIGQGFGPCTLVHERVNEEFIVRSTVVPHISSGGVS